jgi:hypothetical protein
MSKPTRPQHGPYAQERAALERAAETLQAAAARLLAAGVPLADVTALAEAARAYAAEHAAATVARLNRSIGVHTPSLQSTKPIDAVRTVDLPLTPDAPATLTAQERPSAPRRPYLADPCDDPKCSHTYNWHATGGICAVPGCVCKRFVPADVD